MTDPENTGAETLMRAAEVGKKAGLHYVYAGNLPGMVGDWENTRCPNCKELLIERYGYLITGYNRSLPIPLCRARAPDQIWLC